MHYARITPNDPEQTGIYILYILYVREYKYKLINYKRMCTYTFHIYMIYKEMKE